MSSYHVAATSSDSATIKKEEVVEEDGAAVNENCDLNHRLVKKEEEEEKDGDIECNSSKNEDEDDDEDDDDDDDYYADWKVGNWCWVLPSAATNTCNNDVTTTNHQNHTNNHSVKSEEIDTNTNTNTNTNGPSACSSRNRTATTRSSHNTSSNNNEETPKRKKARSLSRPINTAIKREEEDNLCDNNEVNNKMNDDDDDDGYESWTEGNWCLLLPTISNTSTTVKTSNEQQQHSSEISPTNIKRRKQPVHGKYRSQTSPRVNGTGEKKNAFDEDYSDNDDENEEPKKSRTGENTMRAYMKRMDKRWNEMFHRLISYKNQHNSTSVPRNYAADIELGNWVRWQRHVYSNNRMPNYRIDRLNSIGFVWNTYDSQWDEMFNRLMMYKKKHKSTQVPYSYTEDNQLFPLGVWVYKQRYSYRDGKLLKKRMELLNSIDFDWKAK